MRWIVQSTILIDESIKGIRNNIVGSLQLNSTTITCLPHIQRAEETQCSICSDCIYWNCSWCPLSRISVVQTFYFLLSFPSLTLEKIEEEFYWEIYRDRINSGDWEWILAVRVIGLWSIILNWRTCIQRRRCLKMQLLLPDDNFNYHVQRTIERSSDN